MTTNLGSERIAQLADQDIISGKKNNEKISREQIEKEIMTLIGQHFRPEFVNRVDEIVIFNPLGAELNREIVDIQLRQYVQLMKQEKDITLDVHNDAKDRLAAVGFDPVYGARPLKRAIQKYLLDKLALGLITGEIQEGSQVAVSVQDNQLRFVLPKM